jgi:hypothetical protein
MSSEPVIRHTISIYGYVEIPEGVNQRKVMELITKHIIRDLEGAVHVTSVEFIRTTFDNGDFA